MCNAVAYVYITLLVSVNGLEEKTRPTVGESFLDSLQTGMHLTTETFHMLSQRRTFMNVKIEHQVFSS